MFRQRIAVLALPGVVLFALSGCSLLTAPGPDPLTGTAACAQGHTWTADLATLGPQVIEDLKRSGITVTDVTVTGSLTLDWTIEGPAKLANDYVVTVTSAPAADQILTITETVSGTATGAAYINGEVAIPRNWDASAVTTKTVADNNGVAVDPLPFTIPRVNFDDSVGLELTCSPGALTTHPRGTRITQSWTN